MGSHVLCRHFHRHMDCNTGDKMIPLQILNKMSKEGREAIINGEGRIREIHEKLDTLDEIERGGFLDE